MADDIVTRLRDRVAAKREFVEQGSVGHLIYEAADEIERLRKDLGDIAQILISVGESLEDQYGF